MNDEQRCKNELHFGYNHRRHGPSSFAMQDAELVFNELKLKEGDFFLDVGCGAGDYSIYASKIVGDSGKVYALDIWEKAIESLAAETVSQGLNNIKAMVSDITCSLPIKDNCVDVCFIATVLHSLDLSEVGRALFSEIRRILKPDGCVAIIECKKEDMPFGPPKHMRLSAEELENLIRQYGFEKISYVDLGYNFLIQLDLISVRSVCNTK